MDPKLDELTQSFVIGATALVAFVYITRTVVKWIGSDIAPMKVFNWIEDLFGDRSHSNAPATLKLSELAKSAIFLVVFYGLGLFMYDISHDFGAERHNLTAVLDEYMDSDSSLRLRSLFDIPIGTRHVVYLKSTPLYKDLMSVSSEFPKEVQLVSESLRAQLKQPSEYERFRLTELEKLKKSTNRLFYAAKNTVYRNGDYNPELRDLEARSGFFRSLFFLTLICLLCALASCLPRLEFDSDWLVVVILAISAPLIYFFSNFPFENYLGLDTLVALGRFPDKLRFWIIGSRFVLWLIQLLTLIPLILCLFGMMTIWRWIFHKSMKKRSPNTYPKPITIFLLFIFHCMSSYTYVQEITNYNRRVFGYFQSMAVSGAFAATNGLKDDVGSQGILSVLYFQTSGEYVANCLQAFNAAKASLESKLSARKEKPAGKDEKQPLPPAIVCDLDETLLDNSAFQSWLVNSRKVYDEELWQRFASKCADEVIAVPGAVEFVNFAYRKQVPVFFVTNRREKLQKHTIETLIRLGLIPEGVDLQDRLLSQPDEITSSSDKRPRIRKLQEKYDILLFVGDSLGDFGSDKLTAAEDIRSIVNEQHEKWGTDWIVLPNPMYGEWERRAKPYPRTSLRRSKMFTKDD